ncbi:MAG: hypothetical protein ACJATD_000610 [Alloalcanivorax sp.]|jgi:toxic protein SymE
MAERNVMPEYRATESPAGKPARAFPYWRTLKVHRSRDSVPLKPYQGFQPAPPTVPRVLLRGQWLSEAGFGADTLLDVEVSEGRIVLTAVVN